MFIQDPEKRKAWFCGNIMENKLSLFRMAMSILHNDEDAKDAVSEAVYIAYERLESLRQDKAFKRWIMRILVNESYKIYNKRKRSIQLEEDQCVTYSLDDENSSVWTALGALNHDTRTIVMLFYFEGMNVKEIAEVTGLSSGTVKTRLHRARAQLKTILLKEEG